MNEENLQFKNKKDYVYIVVIIIFFIDLIKEVYYT